MTIYSFNDHNAITTKMTIVMLLSGSIAKHLSSPEARIQTVWYTCNILLSRAITLPRQGNEQSPRNATNIPQHSD